MGVLLSAGCSNTVGVDLEEEIGYVYKRPFIPYSNTDSEKVRNYRRQNNFSTKLANKLQHRCVNIGVPGNSNENIIMETIDYIENNHDVDFALINLTSASRFSYMVDKNLHHFNLVFDSEQLKEQTGIKHKSFLHFIEFLRKYCLNNWNMEYKLQHQIRYIISYLTLKSIPYFISSTINNDVDLSTLTDYATNVYMDDFCHEKGFKRLEGGHYGSDAHEAWAQYLYKNIKNYTT